MERELIKENIIDIVKGVLEDSDIAIEVTADDVINVPYTVDGININIDKGVGLSSLDMVSIVVEVENAFDIEVSDEDMFEFRTVNDLTEIVNRKLNEVDNENE